jgi:hypothetical protein
MTYGAVVDLHVFGRLGEAQPARDFKHCRGSVQNKSPYQSYAYFTVAHASRAYALWDSGEPEKKTE